LSLINSEFGWASLEFNWLILRKMKNEKLFFSKEKYVAIKK
jgi:hypothetical protein